MTPNESPAALLREVLPLVEFDAKGYCLVCSGWNMSDNGCTPRKHTKDCKLAKLLASTATAASESRGGVPDGVTHNERVMCEAIVRHQFQDAHRDGRLTIDVETLLHEYNEHKVAAPTPPAVSSGEPTAEQQLAKMVRWLEANQPDVFRRGLWDALARSAAAKEEG